MSNCENTEQEQASDQGRSPNHSNDLEVGSHNNIYELGLVGLFSPVAGQLASSKNAGHI